LVVPKTSLRRALENELLLGRAIPGETWLAWRSLLYAIMGEPLKPEELELFQRLTERPTAPTERVREFYGIIGRRGGKSRAIAALITYLATLVDYRGKLTSGETGVVLCIAPSQTQARIVLDYVHGILEESVILRQLLRRQTSETIELSNGIVIDVRSASFRRLRGQTCVAAIADEAAFWHSDESSNPDREILDAIRPSLMTTGGLLAVISSPYARRGVVWDAFKQNFGASGDPSILVARGPTQQLNPSMPQADIDREYARDPAHVAAEYGAEFRTDVESYITTEALEACTDAGVRERPYDRRFMYSAFCDPSGGAHDAFTLGVAHKEGSTCVLDVIREHRPPFAPEGVVEEFSQILRQYKIFGVRGDRYAGEWPVEQFRKRGITYERSEHTKSELYRDALPLINSRQVALLDDPVLHRQLAQLERKTSRLGKDSIDHGPGARDDVANAAAGALLFAGQSLGDMNFWGSVPYPKVKLV